MFYSLVCLIILGVAMDLSYGKSMSIRSVSLFSLSVLGAKPNWIGTFHVTPLCDQQVCCCFTGPVKVTAVAHLFMTISGKLTGKCFGLPALFIPPILKPTTYSTTLLIVGELNLSEDSSTLTAKSPLGPQCNGRAVRQ